MVAVRTGRFGAAPRTGAFSWQDLGYTDYGDTRRPVSAKGTTWPDPMYGNGWATVWMLLAWQAGRGRSDLTSRGSVPPAKRAGLQRGDPNPAARRGLTKPENPV